MRFNSQWFAGAWKNELIISSVLDALAIATGHTTFFPSFSLFQTNCKPFHLQDKTNDAPCTRADDIGINIE